MGTLDKFFQSGSGPLKTAGAVVSNFVFDSASAVLTITPSSNQYVVIKGGAQGDNVTVDLIIGGTTIATNVGLYTLFGYASSPSNVHLLTTFYCGGKGEAITIQANNYLNNTKFTYMYQLLEAA